MSSMGIRGWIAGGAAAGLAFGLLAATPAAALPLDDATDTGQADARGDASRGLGLKGGPAHVHVDGPADATVRVKRLGGDRYRVLLAGSASGQWMGDRGGQTRVGSLTAGRLYRAWDALRLPGSGAVASLAWDAQHGGTIVPVRVDKPRLTAKGVRFDLTSSRELPDRILGAVLSVAQVRGAASASAFGDRPAPRGSVTPGPYDVNIADDLWVDVGYPAAGEIETGIYNSTNGNYCWKQRTLSGDSQNISVPSNTCDNIAYVNANFEGDPYGAQFENYGSSVQLSYYMYITPPSTDATAPFWFWQVVGTNP